jgi:hypothetical protein
MVFATPLLFALLLAATPDECAVWNRELSFAQSVEHHDAKAFTTHLSVGAVFSAGTPSPTRGRDNVLAEWAPLIEGKTLRLRWHPDIVNIGGDPNIAISRGPFMIEDLRPDAKVKYRVGNFMTIWTRKSPAAPWLVLFDGGEPPATPVDDLAAAEKFMSMAASSCSAK